MAWLAHRSPDRDEPLDSHLAEVGAMAGAFAAPFKAEAWGQAAGLLHDLGKSSDAFQRRLMGDPASADHISAGVQAALRASPLGRLLAYAVAGHHGGMPDAGELAARTSAPAPYDPAALPPLPALARPPAQMAGQGAALFVRMVFSCLTDADFLATEAFYRPELPNLRGTPFDADMLLARLSATLDDKMATVPDTDINRLRRRVLDDCRNKAQAPPGLFTLSVPTGGGKTLAAMAFALAHAKRWGKRRVVTVIPYTSIIEQNAAIYRDALGPENVLEHHSAFRHPADRDGPEPEARDKLRLAEENWDAPVVVTTSVQFFESLFSNRPSRCRKLHNLADSVIVLDEAQLLPTAFLTPCLHVLQALVRDYGCTIVLSTATQPALTDPDWLPGCALTGVTEIVAEPHALHAAMRRVRYEWAGPLDDAAVAECMLAQPQVLTVVNTRRHARELFALIRGNRGTFHLSAAMTPAHRTQVLSDIRAALESSQPCRVVSTQVVECGVDVDFPAVLRSLAGLDSIIQAGGRCNRSGGRNDAVVTVFAAPGHPVPSLWSNHATLARQVLTGKFAADPAAPEAVAWYFRNLFRDENRDVHGICRLLEANKQLAFAFRAAAQAFQLIEGGQVDVTIPRTAEAQDLIRRLAAEGPTPALLRALHPHTVQLRPAQAKALGKALRLVAERVWVLDTAAYDEEMGVRV